MGHAGIWKGVLTTILGATVWAFGYAGKTLFAETPGVSLSVVRAGDGAPTADLMDKIGPCLVVAGGLWTWYLSQKAKQDQYERDKEQADRDARRKADEADQMSAFRLMVERKFAQMEVIHAEAMAAQPPAPPNQAPAPETEDKNG